MQCPKCGSAVLSPETEKFCPICTYPFLSHVGKARLSATTVAGVPWEQVEAIGVAAALLGTLRESLARPGIFFEKVASSRNSFMALLYGLITGSIGAVFSFVWTYYVITPLLAVIPGLDQFTGRNAASVTNLIFTPLIVTLTIVFTAFYVHALLRLTRSSAQNSRATFRVMCYVQSAAVLHCIPLLGSLIAPLWALYLLLTGLSKVHKISMVRASVIILLPVIILLGGLVALAAGLVASGILLQGTLKDLLDLIRY